jgi:hypothetical protein
MRRSSKVVLAGGNGLARYDASNDLFRSMPDSLVAHSDAPSSDSITYWASTKVSPSLSTNCQSAPPGKTRPDICGPEKVPPIIGTLRLVPYESCPSSSVGPMLTRSSRVNSSCGDDVGATMSSVPDLAGGLNDKLQLGPLFFLGSTGCLPWWKRSRIEG